MTNLPVHNQSVDKIIKVHHSQIILEIEMDIQRQCVLAQNQVVPS